LSIATNTIQKAKSARKSFRLSFSKNEQAERIRIDEEMKEEDEEQRSSSMRNQTIFVKIKIAFVFFQVILLFQEDYLIQYPDPYSDFLAPLSFIEFGLFKVTKMDYVISRGFLSKLLFSTILPIGISLLLFVGWIVSRTKFGNDSRQFKIIENTLINFSSF